MLLVSTIIFSALSIGLYIRNRFLKRKNLILSKEINDVGRSNLRLRNEIKSLRKRADAWDVYVKLNRAKKDGSDISERMANQVDAVNRFTSQQGEKQ